MRSNSRQRREMSYDMTMVSGMGWLRPWAIMVNRVPSSPKRVASCSREMPLECLDSDMCKGNSVIRDPQERKCNVPRDGPRMKWLMWPWWADSHQKPNKLRDPLATRAVVCRIEDFFSAFAMQNEREGFACGLCNDGGAGSAVCL